MQANTGPVPEHLKDGRPVLIYGSWAWESLRPYKPGALGWKVATFGADLSYDDDCNPLSGWRSDTENPYSDYAVALAWSELPEPPVEKL
jgi:hypothetical protein